MRGFLAKHFAKVILISNLNVSFRDWQYYALISFFQISVVSFILKELGFWFGTNESFIRFMIIGLMLNAVVGMIRHHFYSKTFSWIKFFGKTGVMLLVIVSAYPILDIITLIIGDNLVTDVFKVTIQVSTFLYPASKILKNVYLISGGQFPPKWVMKNLYNFEKTGNIGYIIHNKKMDDDEDNYDTGNGS